MYVVLVNRTLNYLCFVIVCTLLQNSRDVYLSVGLQGGPVSS